MFNETQPPETTLIKLNGENNASLGWRTIGNRGERREVLSEKSLKTKSDILTSLAKLVRNHFKLIKLESCSLRLRKSYFKFAQSFYLKFGY